MNLTWWRKPPRRRPLQEIEDERQQEYRSTQGWNRYSVITVGPGSLEGPDGLWEGKWLWSGDRLTGIVKAIKEDTRPLPFGDAPGPRRFVWPEGATWTGSVPARPVYRVFIEKPWKYADLPRQYAGRCGRLVQGGLTPRSMFG